MSEIDHQLTKEEVRIQASRNLLDRAGAGTEVPAPEKSIQKKGEMAR